MVTHLTPKARAYANDKYSRPLPLGAATRQLADLGSDAFCFFRADLPRHVRRLWMIEWCEQEEAVLREKPPRLVGKPRCVHVVGMCQKRVIIRVNLVADHLSGSLVTEPLEGQVSGSLASM